MTKTITSTILRLNSKLSYQVKELQEGLIQLGYDIDTADGVFGNKTLEAVCSFQLEHGLEADGEFGPMSYTALYEALGYEVSNPVYPNIATNFLLGDRVKLKKGAAYLNGKKIPSWIFNVDLYVVKINNVNSISVSINKSGTAIGDIAPKFLELLESSDAVNVIINSGAATNSSTTTCTASNLIKIAKAELGYKEKNSDYNLDDADANAGSGNYTKYARDLANAGYYNGSKNGYAWCDVFVDWCFYQLAGKNKTKAEYIQCQSGDCGAACSYSADYYKQAGQWSTSPVVGAQIFFYYNGDINHTGIVINVNNSIIQTIEGNSSDQVIQRQYPIGYSSIAGFGIPRFDTETNSTAVQNIKVKVTANRLNMRESASIDSNVISIVSKGDIFTIIEQEGTYGKTTTGGWIDLSYVEKYEET